MNFKDLAIRNLSENSFRSWVVFLCALLLGCLTLTATIVLRGAENSLRLVQSRLGADIVVVPQGSQSKVENALLLGSTIRVWMPETVLQTVAGLPGVAAATPQLYLSTLKGASCCTVEDMFLIAFDPASDFTVQPWLEKNLGQPLELGEVVGGTYVFTPEGEQNIKIYGYFVTLVGNMEPTGTGLDQTMFLTFETARDVARISVSQAEQPLVIPPGSISAVLVKAAPGEDPVSLAASIARQVPGVSAVASPNMFQIYHRQLALLLRTVILVLGITWVLSIGLIGLIFSLAANERRRELGVLRALGATRKFVLGSMLWEAGFLAISGGCAGIGVGALSVYLFRNLIISSMGMPFLFPSTLSLAGEVTGGLLLSMVSVGLAAVIPAYTVSRQDPAAAMRE